MLLRFPFFFMVQQIFVDIKPFRVLPVKIIAHQLFSGQERFKQAAGAENLA